MNHNPPKNTVRKTGATAFLARCEVLGTTRPSYSSVDLRDNPEKQRGISGPSVTGAIMNAVGVEALPIVLALVCLVLVAVRLARR